MTDGHVTAGPAGAVAQAVDLTKVYGSGEAAVTRARRRERRVRARPADRDHGSVRLRQVDSHALHGRPRHPDLRAGRHRRRQTSSGLKDKALTTLRRDRLGFVFQSFNLVPDAHRAGEHHPAARHRRREARPGVVRHGHRHRGPAATGSRTGRTSSPAASSSASPAPARWSAGRRSSSPTSRPATSTPGPAPRSSGFLRRSVDEFGQSIVMVTHDPVAAAYADRVLFLADGRIVDEITRADRGLGAGPDEGLRAGRTAGLTMLRITLKGVRGHFVRFLLTAFAVMVGVGFVAGTFVLSDSIRVHPRRVVQPGVQGRRRRRCAAPRPATAGQASSGRRGAAPRPWSSTLAQVPGVKRVVPDLQGTALIAGKDGTAVRSGGAPGLGFASGTRTTRPSRSSTAAARQRPARSPSRSGTLELSGLSRRGHDPGRHRRRAARR